MKKFLFPLIIAFGLPAVVAVSQDDKESRKTVQEDNETVKPERRRPAPDPREPREFNPRERSPEPSQRPGPQKEKRTWMGIATGPVPGPVRDYLEIEDGFGIQIVKTMEGSPADKAGLKANDVVLKLDDQLLISPEHLSLLVRRMSKGDRVRVNLLRKGSEMDIELTLGESEMDVHPGYRNPRHAPPQMRGNPHAWQEAMKKQQDYWNEWMKKQSPEIQNRTGRPPSVSMKPGFPVKVFGTEGVVKIDNEKGELTITNDDGEHQIVIKDTDGNVIHEGAFDPDKGTESLPEEAQEHLREMKLDDLKVLTPNSPRPEMEKTTTPPKPKSKEDSDAGEEEEGGLL